MNVMLASQWSVFISSTLHLVALLQLGPYLHVLGTHCTHCLLVEQYFLMFAHLLFEPGFGNTRLADSWEAHCTTGMKRGFASAATLTTRPKIPRSD